MNDQSPADVRGGVVAAFAQPVQEVLGFLSLGKRDMGVEAGGRRVGSREGRGPGVGDTSTHPRGHRLESREADPQRILRVRIHPPESDKEAGPEAHKDTAAKAGNA